MSRLMSGASARYAVIDNDGWGESSADPDDYWTQGDDFVMEGATLVRLNHPYITVTGLIVLAPRPLKGDPTVRDLRRLSRARTSLRTSLWKTLDETGTMEQAEE